MQERIISYNKDKVIEEIIEACDLEFKSDLARHKFYQLLKMIDYKELITPLVYYRKMTQKKSLQQISNTYGITKRTVRWRLSKASKSN